LSVAAAAVSPLLDVSSPERWLEGFLAMVFSLPGCVGEQDCST
jgi:hypothetical protein